VANKGSLYRRNGQNFILGRYQLPVSGRVPMDRH
jgi:hypothetical protein